MCVSVKYHIVLLSETSELSTAELRTLVCAIVTCGFRAGEEGCVSYMMQYVP